MCWEQPRAEASPTRVLPESHVGAAMAPPFGRQPTIVRLLPELRVSLPIVALDYGPRDGSPDRSYGMPARLSWLRSEPAQVEARGRGCYARAARSLRRSLLGPA